MAADDDQLIDWLDSTGKTVEPIGPPGMFDHFGRGAGDAVMSGFARVGRAAAVAAPGALKLMGAGLTPQGEDWYYRNVVDGVFGDAVDHWTPDTHNVGAAGQTVNSLVQGLVPLALGPEGLIGTTGLDTATDLSQQGASAKEAIGAGLTQATAAGLGLKLPAAFGKTLVQRLATGAAMNPVVDATGRLATKAWLTEHPELAQQYDVTGESTAVATLMGLAFGGVHHLGALDVTPQQRDALLTAHNAEHFDAAAPGLPKDGAATAAHHDALATAIRQVLNDKPVDVAGKIDLGQFHRPGDVAGFDAFRVALESGGRDDAASPTSNALGRYQFIPDTWRRVVARAAPPWAHGLTDAQLLALRKDPAKAAEMAQALDAENAAALHRAGAPVDTMSLYAVWHFGAEHGAAFAKAADDTPIDRILTEAQVHANPYLAGKTKGEVVANWTQRARRAGVHVDGTLVDTNPAGQALRRRLVEDPEHLFRDYAALDDSKGGTVLNTDTARELSPEYLADRTRSADVHEAASDTIKALYEAKLAAPTPEGLDPVVLFTAGGTGAGKSTSLDHAETGGPEITYDTNMNTLSSAVTKIEQALAAGRQVRVAYTFRDPVEALRLGALPRAMRQEAKFGSGRTVPLAEHASTHLGSEKVIRQLAERYASDPRVDFRFVDNSRGKGRHRAVALADLPKVNQNGLHERLRASLDEAHAAGEISDAVHAGFLAESSRNPGLGAHAHGQPRPERDGGARSRSGNAPAGRARLADSGAMAGDAAAGNPPAGARSEAEALSPLTTAAHAAIAAMPDLQVMGEDGVLRPAAEFLARADEEAAQVADTLRGLEAAASCFVRTAE